MWIAAAIAGHFELNDQFLIRSVAELVCFVEPGTLMYSTRKK